jgi:hypothetical protein
MKHGLCAPYGESEDSLLTDYSIHGSPFDVSALLKRVRPRGRITVWREGEHSDFGVATTSGISVPVFDGTSSVKLFRAVERFLTREARFLAAAARVRGSRIHRGLTTSILVRTGSLPVGLEFPETLLQLAAVRRVPWAVMCIPCRADGAIAVGGEAVQQGDEADEASQD